MSTNKSISYLLCNKGIIVNLYKLHFQSSHFCFKSLFFSTKQKSFLSFHFSTLPTKHTREKTKYFLSSHFSILLLFFHPPTFPLLQPNGPLRKTSMQEFLYITCKNPFFFIQSTVLSINFLLPLFSHIVLTIYDVFSWISSKMNWTRHTLILFVYHVLESIVLWHLHPYKYSWHLWRITGLYKNYKDTLWWLWNEIT